MRVRDRSVGTTPAESGTASLAFVVAAAMACVVFVVLADVVTLQYTRQSVDAALDEAVRAGSRADAPVAVCADRARAVLAGLLGPTARRGIVVTCATTGTPPVVRARATVTRAAWLPGMPGWSDARARRAVLEVLP